MPAKYRWLLLGLCAIVVVPEAGLAAGLPAINWIDLWNFPYALNAIASILVFVIVVALIRENLDDGPKINLNHLRVCALVFGLVAFFNPTVTVHGLPIVFVVGALMIWYWALPAADRKASSSAFVMPRMKAKLVKASLRQRTASRSISRLRRVMRAKVEAGEVTYQEAEKKIRSLQSSVHSIERDSGGEASAVTRIAFGTYRMPSAWFQAMVGAIAGFVIGLPWMFLSFAGLAHLISQQGTYNVLIFIGVAFFSVLKWTSYGFFYGAFYPFIRGTAGLAKAATLFLTMAVPTVIASLAAANAAESVTRVLVYSLSELFVFFMLLGLATDLFTLRSAGLSVGRISELYDFRFLVAWGSSVAVAIGAAISAALASGVTALVVSVLPVNAHQAVPTPTPTISITPAVNTTAQTP